MKEIIQLLRQQMGLLTRIVELMTKMQQMLREKPSDPNIIKIVQTIEPMLTELSQIGSEQEAICKKYGANDLNMLLTAQQDSVEKYVALRLLSQVGKLQKNLKTQLISNSHLLDRENKFIQFNLNVVTQTKADPIYKPHGNDDIRSRKIFDASC